ncbi:hypothetical protein CEXT_570701 [Caerostris extrusa]|uniref:Uncharacterized protein n=1 Tax=Caerostris extrusa TaxID=172846 RepID=A0AAV4Y4S9_CAEEX|nr:hypothetical protein CEXT_570701 [Caerostris extrusa]
MTKFTSPFYPFLNASHFLISSASTSLPKAALTKSRSKSFLKGGPSCIWLPLCPIHQLCHRFSASSVCLPHPPNQINTILIESAPHQQTFSRCISRNKGNRHREPDLGSSNLCIWKGVRFGSSVFCSKVAGAPGEGV